MGENDSKMLNIFPKPKRSQEEMVGFALIVIIVSIILLVFISFSLKNPEKEVVESYEIEGFIHSFLQYTTECAEVYEPNYVSMQSLIFKCNNEEGCLNGKSACEVLNSTLTHILEEGWEVGSKNPVKGYELEIISEDEEILLLKRGEFTGNYKGSSQEFFKGGNSLEVFFSAYY